MTKLNPATTTDSGEASNTEVSLDPEFEAELAAALACEPTERIERLGRLVQGLQDELDKHEAAEGRDL